MVIFNNIARIFIILSALCVGFLVASEGGHGGSSGGGNSSSGNEGGGYYAPLSTPPVMPPSFNPTAGWSNREPAKIAISDARKKYLEEMKKEKRMLAGLRQGVLRDQRDRAFEKKRRAEKKVKIAEDIAEIDMIAGAAVGAMIGAPAIIIGVTGDAAAAAAGGFTESYVEKGKSVKDSMLNAAGKGIAKGATSVLLGKVKAGGKAASAAFGYTSGKMVDAVLNGDNSNQNTSRGVIDG